jgi:hypothetical protein
VGEPAPSPSPPLHKNRPQGRWSSDPTARLIRLANKFSPARMLLFGPESDDVEHETKVWSSNLLSWARRRRGHDHVHGRNNAHGIDANECHCFCPSDLLQQKTVEELEDEVARTRRHLSHFAEERVSVRRQDVLPRAEAVSIAAYRSDAEALRAISRARGSTDQDQRGTDTQSGVIELLGYWVEFVSEEQPQNGYLALSSSDAKKSTFPPRSNECSSDRNRVPIETGEGEAGVVLIIKVRLVLQ